LLAIIKQIKFANAGRHNVSLVDSDSLLINKTSLSPFNCLRLPKNSFPSITKSSLFGAAAVAAALQ